MTKQIKEFWFSTYLKKRYGHERAAVWSTAIGLLPPSRRRSSASARPRITSKGASRRTKRGGLDKGEHWEVVKDK